MLSNKNCEKYTHNGYCYVKDRDSADGQLIFWRCDERSNGCKGRIWTTSCQNREFVRLITDHSCSTTGDAAKVSVQQILTSVRQRAATTLENPAQIRSNVVQGASTAVFRPASKQISHA
uniref:FLYWCH-type domain-containing protein n=1 Tax=Meloidogyne incognita TaxID=6306 RepID=A0A914L8K1_MELIC